MKPSDIKVGQRYRHFDYPGSIWLGIGKRKPFTNSEYDEKHMVLIVDENPDYIGLIFKTVDDDWGACPEDWERFHEI